MARRFGVLWCILLIEARASEVRKDHLKQRASPDGSLIHEGMVFQAFFSGRPEVSQASVVDILTQARSVSPTCIRIRMFHHFFLALKVKTFRDAGLALFDGLADELKTRGEDQAAPSRVTCPTQPTKRPRNAMKRPWHVHVHGMSMACA